MSEPLRFLFKYPCRGRVDCFFESLDSLNENIRDRNNYHISLTIDTDDDVLNQPEVIERINSYPNVSIGWGLSKSKIDAINRSMPDYDFDVLICWSNDMFATFYGFDDQMRGYMYDIINKNDDDDFLIHFPEPDTNENLNTLYIATKKYYSRFNYIYHPSYLSLWCDNESMAVAQMLNRYYYVGISGLYVHKNPAYHVHGVERDSLFDTQQGHWNIDSANFQERKKINFGLKDSEIINQYSHYA